MTNALKNNNQIINHKTKKEFKSNFSELSKILKLFTTNMCNMLIRSYASHSVAEHV